MVYIIFVNPQMLAQTGMDPGAVFVATCLAAACGSIVMGVAANYPIALAPGMGLNAYFTYGVVLGMGHRWEVALGAVFISGCLFTLLSLSRLREKIIDAIPSTLKYATSAGIGFLLAFLALKSAGVIRADPATLLTLGDLRQTPTLLAGAGFTLIAALDVRRVPGAVVLGILAVALAGAALGESSFSGVFSLPPSVAPTLLAMDLRGALEIGLITIVFSFLFVDLFDTAGTLIGVAQTGGFLDSNDRLPRIGRALLADSSATVLGAVLGTSTTTSYVESTLGVQAGGRTGLTAVLVGLLFLMALFLAPLAGSIPAFATAPALFYVACAMSRTLTQIDWSDAAEAAPALLTILGIGLTLSIATGIGLGLLAYVAIRALAGRASELSPGVWGLAGLFALRFIAM
jgi:AGZA family xanthine/uracil permease-like MFS transporter